MSSPNGIAINSGAPPSSNAPTARKVARCWHSTPITLAINTRDVTSVYRFKSARYVSVATCSNVAASVTTSIGAASFGLAASTIGVYFGFVAV